MNIKIKRFAENKLSTLGRLLIDDKQFCYTLEDGYNAVKVVGQTRIPSGIYKLGMGPEDSPKTKVYRDKYDFFRRHIELQDVPNFTKVYLHVGNYVTDSEGCILLGATHFLNGDDPHTIGASVKTFTEFYKLVYPAIERGEEIFLEIV